MADLFVRFGGHQHAAGVTLEAARMRRIPRALQRLRRGAPAPRGFHPAPWRSTPWSRWARSTKRAVAEIFALAPFGHGNPPPLFAALDVEIAGPPVVMKEKHLRLMVRQNGRTLTLKAWNFAARAAEMAPGARVDIAFTLEEDAYSAARGYPGWCAVLRDVRERAALSARGERNRSGI